MKKDIEKPIIIRQVLEQGADSLSLRVVTRLAHARNSALDHQKVVGTGFRLAGAGSGISNILLPRARGLLAILAITLGVMGTYYWDSFEQADDGNDEIDSALLADELPIDAYTDHGFQAWLAH